MRILVVSNLYPPQYIGGYELICRGVVEYLRHQGHQAHVLTSDYQADSSDEPPGSGIDRTLRVHGLFGNPWLPIWKLAGLETHNNRVLRRIVRQFEPDLVYCWNFSGLSKSMLFTLKRMRLSAAFCVCDHWMARGAVGDVWLRWWNTPAKPRPLAWLLSMAGARAVLGAAAPTPAFSSMRFRNVHFCSRAIQEFTKQAGCNVDGSTVIYCPVDTERFNAPVKAASLPLRRLLYVGRLHEDKGVLTALRALACLRDTFQGELTLCGRGEPDYESKLKAFVQQEHLPVRFTSVTAPGQMAEVYASHDALVFPSEWFEPFALTPLEAMASGLPVIGTTNGGSAELFVDGENALTWAACDPSDLARRIQELSTDRELRVRIASAGQRDVRERFAEPVIHGQIEAFLKKAMDSCL